MDWSCIKYRLFYNLGMKKSILSAVALSTLIGVAAFMNTKPNSEQDNSIQTPTKSQFEYVEKNTIPVEAPYPDAPFTAINNAPEHLPKPTVTENPPPIIEDSPLEYLIDKGASPRLAECMMRYLNARGMTERKWLDVEYLQAIRAGEEVYCDTKNRTLDSRGL